jgi:hypothetical protein
MTSPAPKTLRVPVGSLVSVAPPGAGKTTVLRAALAAAGLPADRIVCRDDLRAGHGTSCSDLAHKMAPMTCMHFEPQVTAAVNARANSHLVNGQTWLYDQTGCNETYLRVEVERAHRQGLAAVALRRVGNDGARDATLEFCLANNANRNRQVPAGVVTRMWNAYAELTSARLREIGFDVVLEWNDTTTFELMPEGVDARHITGPLAITGDLHNCAQTFFERLLPALGTDRELSNPDLLLVSVGDLHDKGGQPDGGVELIRWWLWAVKTGRALLVDSNHNKALVRALLTGGPVRFGLKPTIDAINAQPDADQLKAEIVAAFSRLPSHLIFADTVVVHAAMTESRLGKSSAETRGFALYTRYSSSPWEWTGTQTLVHGHVVVDGVARRRAAPAADRPGHVPGEVVAIDTGAYRGGGLTAYLSSTGETVTVPTVPADVIDQGDADALTRELVAAGLS